MSPLKAKCRPVIIAMVTERMVQPTVHCRFTVVGSGKCGSPATGCSFEGGTTAPGGTGRENGSAVQVKRYVGEASAGMPTSTESAATQIGAFNCMSQSIGHRPSWPEGHGATRSLVSADGEAVRSGLMTSFGESRKDFHSFCGADDSLPEQVPFVANCHFFTVSSCARHSCLINEVPLQSLV